MKRPSSLLTISGVAVGYGHFNQALMRFKAPRRRDRRPVYVSYDPAHLETIRVHDEQLRFVCVAEMNMIVLDCWVLAGGIRGAGHEDTGPSMLRVNRSACAT